MAKLSLPELKAYVTSLVTKAKISNASFVETRDNIVGLLDKIGKIVTVDTVYSIDKLNKFDGEYLSFGKTIEEWQQDLIMVEDFDPTGANALAPHEPTYRPVFYSYTLGQKTVPTTIRNNNIERAVHFEEQFVSIVAMQYKRLEDSVAQYRYALKKEMIAKLIAIANDEMTASSVYATSTEYVVNTVLKKTADDNTRGIVVKKIAATNSSTWAQNVAAGYIIELDLITEIAKPSTAETGEAFVEQVKNDIEKASDVSEGHSLNGNTLGATEGLTLILKQGVMAPLEVQTMAGAFHDDKLAMPCDIVVVNSFGSADADYFAVLLDNRGMRLHNTYDATREDMNGKGDFLNVYRQLEHTAYISRNSFLKVYKAPSV